MARTFEKIPPEILTLKLLCQYKSKGKRWQPRTSDKNMDHFRYVNAILRPYLSCVTNLCEHKYSFSNYHIMSGCGGSCISKPPPPPRRAIFVSEWNMVLVICWEEMVLASKLLGKGEKSWPTRSVNVCLGVMDRPEQ